MNKDIRFIITQIGLWTVTVSAALIGFKMVMDYASPKIDNTKYIRMPCEREATESGEFFYIQPETPVNLL